jgi:RNA polymerase sigma factor (sigma-70 family)
MQRLTPEQAEQVEKNLKLVPYVIHRYFPRLANSADMEDWMQIGMLGLCKAVIGFDTAKGLQFSTYACYAIKSSIIYELNKDNKREWINDQKVASTDWVDTDRSLLAIDLVKDPMMDTERSVFATEILSNALSQWDADPLVFKAAIGQITRREAAKQLGVSHTTITNRINQLRLMLKEEEHGQNQHGCDC